MKKIIPLFLLAVVAILSVSAKEITLSVNQTDYYFLVGETAAIPLDTENTYDKTIDGMLSYTITQEINQGGMHFSSSNTQSNSLSVQDGEKTVYLNFGSSNNPSTLKVSMNFNYEDKTVSLTDIMIHFVQDESQKQNQQQQKQSTTQQQNQQQQNSLSQQMQQLQQQMNQMFNQEPQQQSNTQKLLQNSQMAQDSNALKQQMQKQMQEQQKLKEEFAKTLSQNQDFQKEHQQLLQQSYQQTPADLNPISNNTGDFQINYQKGNETASLKGYMLNGNLTKMQKTTTEDIKTLLEELEKNPQFQKYHQELQKESFQQQLPEIEQLGNMTSIKIPYLNQKNETASIQALMINNTVKEVTLEKPHKFYWWLLLLLPLFAALGYLVYVKYFKKKEEQTNKITQEKSIDYKKEALKLLKEAKQLFNNKHEKDAYGKAAEAIRFYYSYKLNLKTELTNFELIKLLKRNKISYAETQKCLNLCSLVEFAKYIANQADFDEIINSAEKVII